jgi:hypothetical protein
MPLIPHRRTRRTRPSGRQAVRRLNLLNAVERPFAITEPFPGMQLTESSFSRNVHRHVSTLDIPAWLTTSSTVQTFAARGFTSADISDFTYLAAVFDQYKINRIQAWITPRWLAAGSNTFNAGQLVSAIDYDDATAWSAITSGTNYANSILTGGGQGHYRDFIPHVAVAMWAGSFTGYGNTSGAAQWIDSASTGVVYYGLKAGATVTDSAYVYDLTIRIWSEFRQQR